MDLRLALLGPRASVLVVSADEALQRAVADLLRPRGCALRRAHSLATATPPSSGDGDGGLDLYLLDWRALPQRPADALRLLATGAALLLLGAPPEGAPLSVVDGALPWPAPEALLLLGCERALERLQLAREGRRLGERMRQVEEDWVRTLDTIPDAVAVCDGAGRIVRGNLALREIVGLSAELHRPIDEALAPLQLRRRIEEAVAAGSVSTFDESPPGLGRTYTITVSPLRGEAAGSGGAALLLRDVTDERRMQRRLLLGERMAAVGQLAAGLAHEINNPVSFVLSNLQMARELLHEHGDRLPASLGELDEMIDECLVGTTRVCDIVRDLRTFTSAEVRTGEGEVRLDDLIELALRMTRSEVQRRARLVYDRDLSPIPPLRGDAGKLSHVLLNLLAQAVQNLPSPEESGRLGHCVTVRTRIDRGRGAVELVVADTGPTLSEEVRAHLFEPFAQRRLRLPPGLSARIGMGLAVSYEVVRRHGGEIEARAGAAGGNELIVRLPLPAAAPPEPRPPRRRVLFVDDEPLLLRSYQRLIGDLHDVTTVSSGTEALALLQGGECFDTIFCDLSMPEMDGAQLYRTVRRRDEPCARRFVFLTGGVPSAEALTFLREVENAHVDKPVGRESLVRAIEQLQVAP